MRHFVLTVLLTACAVIVGTPNMSAQAPVSAAERGQLVQRLSSYNSCNASCAQNLAVLIVDQGVASALALAGVVKGSDKLKTDKMYYLAMFAVLRQVWASGGTIIDTHKVCAQTCDSMYQDVVALGQAGLLGPITNNSPVPESWFNDAKVKALWSKHFRPLKPIDLPPQFHNDAKWKAILNTA